MSDVAMPRLGRLIIERPALAIAIIASAISFVGLVVIYSRGGAAFDFRYYWTWANDNGADAYLAPGGRIIMPYPPTMLMMIKPLAAFDPWPAYFGWVGLSLVAFLAASRQHLEPRAMVLAMFSPAMAHCLFMGQVAAMMTALLIYAFATPKRWRAGVALALVAVVKPPLVTMAPLYLLATRDWRAFGGAAAGTAALIAISVALFGVAAWFDWVAAVPKFYAMIVNDNNNALSVAITPAGVARHWGFDPTPFVAAGIVLGIWLVVTTKATNPLSATAIVATASLLSSPYALVYDLLPLVPFLAREILRGRLTASFALGMAIGPLPLILSIFCLRSSGKEARPLATGFSS